MNPIHLKIISIHIQNSPQAMPLAPALLKSALDADELIHQKVKTSFDDYYLNQSAEEIAKAICNAKPDMLGFSVYLWNRSKTIEIAKLIKAKIPNIILFAGGAEATALPIKLLKAGSFDFVIYGEGELALKEVVHCFIQEKPLIEIKGVVTTDRDIPSPLEPWPVSDLNAIPSPFLNGILNLKKYSGVLWELSRGCPFKCDFCFESRGVAGVRRISLERIEEELKLLEAEGVSQIFVLDPTFNQDRERAKTILRLILEIAPTIHFTFEVRTEFIDEEMAELFSQINCSLQIGLQSAIPEVLAQVNRKVDMQNYAGKINLLNQAGVTFGLDLIYGLPGDDFEGFCSSIDAAFSFQPNHIDIFPLAVLPGTVLYDNAEKFELNFIPDAPYILINSPGFSADDMQRAKSLANACDVFYNRGKAVGWLFMITETLELSSSEFFLSFAEFLKDKNPGDEVNDSAIFELQCQFTKEIFREQGKEVLFPVMKAIMQFHNAMHRSLFTAPPAESASVSDDEGALYHLAESVVLLELPYHIEDLMQVGEYNLEEFLANFGPEPCQLLVYNCFGEVKSVVVNAEFFSFLKNLKEPKSLVQLFSLTQGTENEVVKEWVEYGFSEGILALNNQNE